MSRRNREKRAAKKANRQHRGSGRTCHAAGGAHSHTPVGSHEQARSEPPPPPVERLSAALMAAGHDYANGEPSAAATWAAILSDSDVSERVLATAAGIALASTLDKLWARGWLPADLWEITWRRSDDTATSLLVDSIAADTARHAPARVHEDWAAQVRRLDATVWWGRDTPHLLQWAGRHGLGIQRALHTTIALIGELMTLRELPRILPPPGTATPGDAAPVARVDQKVLARVRGLLAKAESTEFPEEAEALSAKAQELMNRHAFERALLDADDHKQQAVASVRLWLDNPYVEAKSHLVSRIARANRCRTVFYPEFGFLAVVGEQLDLEITELLSTSLLVQATRAMVAEGSHTTGAGVNRTRSFRRAFLISYAMRIGERLTEASSRAHDPAEAARLLPVLANRSHAVEEAFQRMFSDTVQRPPVSISNGAGWHAGRAAADRANLDIERHAVTA